MELVLGLGPATRAGASVPFPFFVEAFLAGVVLFGRPGASSPPVLSSLAAGLGPRRFWAAGVTITGIPGFHFWFQSRCTFIKCDVISASLDFNTVCVHGLESVEAGHRYPSVRCSWLLRCLSRLFLHPYDLSWPSSLHLGHGHRIGGSPFSAGFWSSSLLSDMLPPVPSLVYRRCPWRRPATLPPLTRGLNV